MNRLGRGACAAIVLATITLTGACATSGGGGGGGGGTNWEGCYHATVTTFADIRLLNPPNQENNAIIFGSSDGSCVGGPAATTLISLVVSDQALADTVCQVTYGKNGAFPLGGLGYVKSDGVQFTDGMYYCY